MKPHRRVVTAPKALCWILVSIGTPGSAGDTPSADAAPRDRYAAPGPLPVGVRTLVLVDESRHDPVIGGPRTLVTEVWYPAIEEARGRATTTFAEFFGAHPEAGDGFARHFRSSLEAVNRRFLSRAVRDAEARKGRFPLIVFSHGNGGLRHQNSTQMDHLASHGFIVASPDHTGNAGVTVIGDRIVPYAARTRGIQAPERPRDLLFVADSILGLSKAHGGWLEGRIEGEGFGLLGHSFGGFAACQAAAMDPRVKAVCPMTVALLRTSRAPMLLMLARLDDTIKEVGNALNKGYYASYPGRKYLLELTRGGHYSFSDMDRIQPNFGDGIGRERRGGVEIEYLDTLTTRNIINAYTLAFFDRWLRSNEEAGRFLETNAWPEEVDYRFAPEAPPEPAIGSK